jgi:hypothetical protein
MATGISPATSTNPLEQSIPSVNDFLTDTDEIGERNSAASSSTTTYQIARGTSFPVFTGGTDQGVQAAPPDVVAKAAVAPTPVTTAKADEGGLPNAVPASAKGSTDQADAELKSRLGSAYKAPASHDERVALAAKVAKGLKGAELDSFLNAMEEAGKKDGLNFGLSRMVDGKKVPLNSGVTPSATRSAASPAAAQSAAAPVATPQVATNTQPSVKYDSDTVELAKWFKKAPSDSVRALLNKWSFGSDKIRLVDLELQSPAMAKLWNKLFPEQAEVNVADMQLAVTKLGKQSERIAAGRPVDFLQ